MPGLPIRSPFRRDVLRRRLPRLRGLRRVDVDIQHVAGSHVDTPVSCSLRALPSLPAVSLILLALLPAPACFAWLEGGHVVAARIAYDRLSPEARAEADRLVAVLAGHEPRRESFVTASVWLDDIKTTGWGAFNRWHYINLPYNAGGLMELPPANTDNAVDATLKAVETLRDPDAVPLARAFALRVLLHVVPDLHQPLHCISRFTPQSPGGDRGGNDFELEGGNLHYFWDDAGGLFGSLDADSPEQRIAAAAADLLRRVPEAALPAWRQPSPMDWARESHRLAVTVAYVGILEGRAPSDVYRTRVQLVAQRRLVMAGYRLAALLESLLGGAAEPE